MTEKELIEARKAIRVNEDEERAKRVMEALDEIMAEDVDADALDNLVVTVSGLTKREYFAVHLMQGLLARPTAPAGNGSVSEISVAAADALIAELNKVKNDR